jgi:cellulase
VDRMINNNGWVDFTLPSCIASGDYLLRAEIIALHSASKQGEAQFYV